MKDVDLVKVLAESVAVAAALDKVHKDLAGTTNRLIVANQDLNYEKSECESLRQALDDACTQRDAYLAKLVERQAALTVGVGNMKALITAVIVQISKATGYFCDSDSDVLVALNRAAAHAESLSDLLDAAADDAQQEAEEAVFAGEAAQRDRWLTDWDAVDGEGEQ